MLFKWRDGRQRTGYRVMTLFSSHLLRCDIHLIWYGVGSRVPPHKDPVPNPRYRHHRFNVVLKKPKIGGYFRCAGPYYHSFDRRVIYFCPENTHSVTRVGGSSRVVISFGWLTKKKADPLNEFVPT